MARTKILLSCPDCHRIQHHKHLKCRYCGKDLQRAKRKLYYVEYYNPQGNQKRERAGYSLATARQIVNRLLTEAKSTARESIEMP